MVHIQYEFKIAFVLPMKVTHENSSWFNLNIMKSTQNGAEMLHENILDIGRKGGLEIVYI